MNMDVLKVIGVVLSIIFSFILLETSGVDITKANILKLENFSISVFSLLAICIYFFEKLIVKSIELVSLFFSSETSHSK
jgi:hypothetical protein